MKKMLVLLLMLGAIPLVSANVIMTEVMFDPTQTSSQTDSEWIEIYNKGNEPIDLSDWKVDGNNFEDFTLLPGRHLVIARELTDGSDTDNESFESYWGNNDGVWNESDGFLAIDGYFSLADEDTINLSNGSVSVTLYYNSSTGQGNGKSIIRTNYSSDEWTEGSLDGTPGRGEAETLSNEVDVQANVINVPPEILTKAIITDDSSQEGTQIMPNVNENKSVEVTMTVTDTNGKEDISQAGVRVLGREFFLTEVKEENNTLTYNGTFEMLSADPAAFHSLEFFVKDNNTEATDSLQFEYLGMLSSIIETTLLTFDSLIPGTTSDEQFVNIRNTGNVVFDTEVEGFNLNSGEDNIPKDNLEVFKDMWYSLSIPRLLDVNVQPDELKGVKFRLKVPSNLKAKTFNGKLRVTSVAS